MVSHYNQITKTKVVFGIVCGCLVGAVFVGKAVRVFSLRNAPVVEGIVIDRQPVMRMTGARADFTIRIADSSNAVHAITQRYLIDQVPERVRFHYSGDPNKEVFLFEHENNPYWIVLIMWGSALLLTVGMRTPWFRRQLKWE